MLPEKNMRVFMGVNLGVLVLAVLLGARRRLDRSGEEGDL